MGLISAYIQLSRPGNVGIAMLSILIAVSLGGKYYPLSNIILAVISTGLITVGANVINDYFDIETDKINKPNRPLAAGIVTPDHARIFFYTVYGIAFILAFLMTLPLLLIAVSVGILLYLYSYRLKRTVIWGNLAVSMSSAMAFIYGGLAVNAVRAVYFPALFAFFFHFGREIIKDMEDVEGDRQTGANTMAVVYGYQISYRVTGLVFTGLLILTLIPYFLKIYNEIYLWIIVIGIYPILGYIIVYLKRGADKKRLGIFSMILKIDMLVGLLAIYLG